MTDPTAPGLRRTLSTRDLVGLGINGVVGAGIFIFPGQIAATAGGWAWLVYLGGSVLCFLIALCFAEMGGRHRGTGGTYLYALDAFGPFVGYLVGWIVWLSSVLGWASVAVGLCTALPTVGVPTMGAFGRVLCVAALVSVLVWINVRGARPGAWTNNLFSIGKLVPLSLFVVLGLGHVQISPFAPEAHWHGLQDIPNLLLWSIFLYSGFEDMPVPAGETEDPQRAVPRAIMIVLGTATVLYLAIHLVAQAACPRLGEMMENPLSGSAFFFLGVGGVRMLGIGSVISQMGTCASIAVTGPRSMFALALDRFLPRPLAAVDPVSGTPRNAILATGLVVVLLPLVDLLGWGNFNLNTLVEMSTLGALLQYSSTTAAVLVTQWRERRSGPAEDRRFKLSGGPLIPALSLVFCLTLFYLAERRKVKLLLVGIVLGAPLYLFRTVAQADKR